MIRCRFKCPVPDPRPVEWPIKHPYWVTGHSFNREGEGIPVLVAYADNEAEIRRLWPEAEELDSEEATEYKFTTRFPKPEWLR